MPIPTITIERSLLGRMKELTPNEAKLLLLLMLLANPQGFVRTSLRGLAEMLTQSQWVVDHLISKLGSQGFITYRSAQSPTGAGVIRIVRYFVPEGEQLPLNLPIEPGEGSI